MKSEPGYTSLEMILAVIATLFGTALLAVGLMSLK